MNKVILIGNLTKNPETRVTANGNMRTTFTIAVNRPRKDAGGQQEADFIMVTAYGKTAETAEKYLSKGRKVGIIGRIRTGKYEKDGKTVFSTEIIVEQIEFLSSARQDSGQTQQDSVQSERAPEEYDDYTQGYENLPF